MNEDCDMWINTRTGERVITTKARTTRPRFDEEYVATELVRSGAEVHVVAASQQQAQRVFDVAKRFIVDPDAAS